MLSLWPGRAFWQAEHSAYGAPPKAEALLVSKRKHGRVARERPDTEDELNGYIDQNGTRACPRSCWIWYIFQKRPLQEPAPSIPWLAFKRPDRGPFDL